MTLADTTSLVLLHLRSLLGSSQVRMGIDHHLSRKGSIDLYARYLLRVMILP